MERRPFTLQQAIILCKHYQKLIGSHFDRWIPGKGTIECVAVAPFETSKQWQFAQFYKETKDPLRALRFYQGTDFDVVVLATPFLRKRNIHFKDIRAFLEEEKQALMHQKQE